MTVSAASSDKIMMTITVNPDWGIVALLRLPANWIPIIHRNSRVLGGQICRVFGPWLHFLSLCRTVGRRVCKRGRLLVFIMLLVPRRPGSLIDRYYLRSSRSPFPRLASALVFLNVDSLCVCVNHRIGTKHFQMCDFMLHLASVKKLLCWKHRTSQIQPEVKAGKMVVYALHTHCKTAQWVPFRELPCHPLLRSVCCDCDEICRCITYINRNV